MNRTRQLRSYTIGLVAAVALAILVVACTSPHSGKPGTVTGREAKEHCRQLGTGTFKHWSCSSRYEITTKPRHCSSHEFGVQYGTYLRCRGGSSYPACASR